MSITATIDEPINDDETDFDFPVCTEAIYKELILPSAIQNSLHLVFGWGTMTEITGDNRAEFERQLRIVQQAIKENHAIPSITRIQLGYRLQELIDEISAYFAKRSDITILIG